MTATTSEAQRRVNTTPCPEKRCHFILMVMVKEFWKSVSISQSYRQK